MLLLICTLFLVGSRAAPNIVLIIGESTDGRLLRDDSPIPLPNVRLLKKSGVFFDSAYSNNPVCAPSRSSFWSGRAPHHIPHTNNGFLVNGVWNNYEGLTPEYLNTTLDALLESHGYSVELLGKMDRSVGGHSITDRLESLTHNVDVPFNIMAGIVKAIRALLLAWWRPEGARAITAVNTLPTGLLSKKGPPTFAATPAPAAEATVLRRGFCFRGLKSCIRRT